MIDGERTTGQDVRMANVTACMAIANIVRDATAPASPASPAAPAAPTAAPRPPRRSAAAELAAGLRGKALNMPRTASQWPSGNSS